MIFTGRSGRSGQWIWNGLERKAEPRKSLAAYQEGKLAEEVANLLREDFQTFKKDWIHSCEEFCLAMPIHRFRSTWIVYNCSMFHAFVHRFQSHHRRTAARCNSPWLVLSWQGPVICRSRSRFEHITTWCTWWGRKYGGLLWYLWYVATILQHC